MQFSRGFVHGVVELLPVLPVSDENLQPLERSLVFLSTPIFVVLPNRPILQIDRKAAKVVGLDLVLDVEDLAGTQLRK